MGQKTAGGRQAAPDQAGASSCKWPIGDPADSDFRFCSQPAKPGEYCAQHKKPKRGKGHNFATRLTDETFQALKDEAARTGRSMSQVAEMWMEQARTSTVWMRDLEVAPAIQSMIADAYLVQERYGPPSKSPLGRYMVQSRWRDIIENHLTSEPLEDEGGLQPIQPRDAAEAIPAALKRIEAEVEELTHIGGPDLRDQIQQLLVASAATQREARRLTSALKRERTGAWGEQTLRNVLEASGASPFSDFLAQLATGRGPDVVIKMPGGGNMLVDAKAPLAAYLEAQDAADDVARDRALQRHAEALLHHAEDLSAVAYWNSRLDAEPDFVALFVPGDAFLTAALDRIPNLVEIALRHRVVIVTPTTLFGLLKAIGYGWRAEAQTKSAETILRLGSDLYDRLGLMAHHTKRTGDHLKRAVESYNQFVQTLESQVLVTARRFGEVVEDAEREAGESAARLAVSAGNGARLNQPGPADAQVDLGEAFAASMRKRAP